VTISKKARKMKRTLYISLYILGRTRTAKEVRKFGEIIASEERKRKREISTNYSFHGQHKGRRPIEATP